MVHRVVYTRPYDARVEYLASPASASTYIDTGLKQSDIVSIETQFADISGYGGSYRYSIGSGTGSNDSNIIGFKVYNGNLTVNLKGSTTTISSGHLNTFKTVSVNFVTGAVKINSAERELTPCELTDDILYLFKIPTLRGQRYGFQPIMLKYFKAFGANNTLIRDMIPVRIGTIGYMYDKVSGKLFENKGTGNFVLGQDVSNPVPKIRNVVYYSPYDAEVEYLESTGTQWINTGVIPTRTTHIQVYKSFTRSDQNLGGDGIYNGRNIRFHDGIYEGKFHFGIGNSQNWVNTIIADTNKHLFELFGSGYAKLDGTTYNISNGYDTYNWEFALFRRIGANEFTGEQIVYCKIYQEDTLVRDFIPVRRGTKGYMYDKVSKKLFGNQGTGRFILGNDVVKPNFRCIIPMPYDSKIEYLESTGTQWIDTGEKSVTGVIEIDVIGCISNYVTSIQQALIGADRGFNISAQASRYKATSNCISDVTPDIDTMVHMNLISDTLNNSISLTINEDNFSGTYSNFVYNGKIGLFALGNGATKSISKIKCAKIKINNVLVKNFIPVRRGNIGYMYDRVSGKLFGNLGTGQFILGNDIND